MPSWPWRQGVCYRWPESLPRVLAIPTAKPPTSLGNGYEQEIMEEDWRGKHAWERYQKEWAAKGESFDFAHFIPPPVPDDQNFALTPVVASCCAGEMDKNGRPIKPENTNIVDRLTMELSRRFASNQRPVGMSSNMMVKSWRHGELMDLKAWQDYYRLRFATNLVMQPRRTSNLKTFDEFDETEALPTNDFPVAAEAQSPADDVLLALGKYDSAVSGKLPWNFYLRTFSGLIPLHDCARVQTDVDLARVACALERYRQIHGNYPEALAEVAPLFPGPFPHDIITGEPLHYRRTENGNFLLYSVGWNGKDDGGVPPQERNFDDLFFHERETGGDWVWMFPAR
jgi:hypothetical protein